MDESNSVAELFSLNAEIYEKVYGDKPNFKIDEVQILHRFKERIFSKKPFKLINLTDESKNSFVKNIEIPHNYIPRTFSTKPNNFSFYLIDDGNSKKLTDVIQSKDKIFVLGNPGTGKSTELKKLALQIFKVGPQSGFVPIFRNLRDFTTSDDINSYLNINIDDFDNLVFILDGIDEIADIEYFKSKLIQFINKNESLQKNFKYVLSCRTNIYEIWIRDFKEFSTFYLNNLTHVEVFNLLESSCGDIIKSLEFSDNVREFLNNPFQVEILAAYINTNGKTPDSTHELWKSYIDERISIDKHEKLRKIKLIPPLIKEYSKKMSLINELMKTNVMKEEDIFSMTNKDSKTLEEYLKSPLLEVQANSTNRSFEHRNIQEYFAAMVISSKKSDEIVEFIQVDDTGKTHPSLFNTITFLLNLFPEDSEKHIELIKWFLKNEYEILFKADGNRLNNKTRVEVFQRYFKTSCIDSTLWISTVKTYDLKEIAAFGNIPENYYYLIDIIKSNKAHERAIISAIDLLSYINIPESEERNLEVLIVDSFKNSSISKSVKACMVSLVERQNLVHENLKFLGKIFQLFKLETNRQINRRLLSLLDQQEDVDEYFEYIHEEFLRANNLSKRIDDDNVNRGNDRVVEQLILKFKSSENLLKILGYYFDKGQKIRLNGMFERELTDKLRDLISKDDDFASSFIEMVQEVFEFRLHDRFLEKLISETKIEKKVIEYLLKKKSFKDSRYFIADISTENSLSIVVDFLKKSKVDEKEVEYFRNNLGNLKNWDLASSFHKRVEKLGYKFTDPSFSVNDVLKLQEERKEKTQENFDLLFNKTELLNEYEVIFSAHANTIDYETFDEIKHEWYEQNGHGSIISPSLSLLEGFIRRQPGQPLDFKKLKEILNNKDVIINQIIRSLKNNNNSNWKYDLKNEQLSVLEKWCLEKIKVIDFTQIIIPLESSSYHYGVDYKIVRRILYLYDKFSFELPLEFLLKSIKYYEQIEQSFEFENFLKFKEKIGSDDKFENQIYSNLKTMDLEPPVPYFHIKYALEEGLLDVFPQIENYFLSRSHRFNEETNINQYFEIIKKSRGIGSAEVALLSLCKDIDDRLFWIALNLLNGAGLQRDYCIKKSIEYLESLKDAFSSEALTILFIHNHPKAIGFLIKILKSKPDSSVRFINLNNYSHIDDYKILDELYALCYLTSDDGYESHLLRGFYSNYISNLSKNKEGYEKVRILLEEIKQRLLDKDDELFYINLLIVESKNSYINSKSKPMDFPSALAQTNKLID